MERKQLIDEIMALGLKYRNSFPKASSVLFALAGAITNLDEQTLCHLTTMYCVQKIQEINDREAAASN